MGYLLKFGYGSEKKEHTMLEFTFYNVADENKQYCITYFCFNSKEIESVYKSINSITFE